MALDLRMKFSADTSGLQQQITSVASSIKSAFGAVAGAAALSGVASMIKSVSEYAGGLQDLSEQTGFSTDALQELNYAAINGGSSIEDMTTAIRKMQDVLGQKKATDDQIKALDKLGLGFNQLKAMAPEEAFKKLAEAISNIPNQMERTAAATDFFGKGGMKIASMAGDMDKFAKAAHDAGAVVDKELIKSVADFDDAVVSSIQTVKSWGISVIGAIQKVASSAGKLSEGDKKGSAIGGFLLNALTASNPMLGAGLIAVGAGAVLGDAAGGSVDIISKADADKKAADAQAENIKKAATAEEAEAKDKREREKMQSEEIAKHNKAVLDGIEKARDADQKAGEDALEAWKKRLDAIKKIDAAQKAVADAEKRLNEVELDAADKAAANRRDDNLKKLEGAQDKANKNLEAVQERQRERLGGVAIGDALKAAVETPVSQRQRRKRIEEDARFRALIEDRIAGGGGRVNKRDLAKLQAMNDELARAKGFKNAADMKADAAKKEALKAQDLKDQRDANKAMIQAKKDILLSRKALETLAQNLKVAG